ncbi:hypothetical protein [Dongia deserti]|uniref:hypothetical protein n=1 Tax=Dongia deserti TaxID=2268030 RepID=UPI0013C45E06|nr:hypothetical protein [Dongia deserti]
MSFSPQYGNQDHQEKDRAILPGKPSGAIIAIQNGRCMPMQRFDLLDEYATICVPVRMQKGLPKSSTDERDEQLMRAGYLVVSIGWFFRTIAAFVRRIARLLIDPRMVRRQISSAEASGRESVAYSAPSTQGGNHDRQDLANHRRLPVRSRAV